MSGSGLCAGMVVAAFGRRYLVELEDGSVRSCLTRGKRSEVACGDKVRIRLSGSEDGVIETCDTRRNLIQRASTERHKLIAANVDLVAIVVSGEPLFSDEFVARGLSSTHGERLQGIEVGWPAGGICG